MNWKPAAEIRFPAEAVAKFGKLSSSGGSFGPDRHLFITGHDAQELYVLDLPVTGDFLELEDGDSHLRARPGFRMGSRPAGLNLFHRPEDESSRGSPMIDKASATRLR